MHHEIKTFCAKKQWREAIDFVSQIEPGHGSGKREGLKFIGDSIINEGGGIENRDQLLADIIEALFQLGDIESPSKLVLELSDRALQDKYGAVIKGALEARQAEVGEEIS